MHKHSNATCTPQKKGKVASTEKASASNGEGALQPGEGDAEEEDQEDVDDATEEASFDHSDDMRKGDVQERETGGGGQNLRHRTLRKEDA